MGPGEYVRLGLPADLGDVEKKKKKRKKKKKATTVMRDQSTSVTPLLLSVATARLDSHVRPRGLTAHEMLYQQDQVSHNHLPLDDRVLTGGQQSQRGANHRSSVRSRAPSGRVAVPMSLQPGDLAYRYGGRNKSRACDRYLGISTGGAWCNSQRFADSQRPCPCGTSWDHTEGSRSPPVAPGPGVRSEETSGSGPGCDPATGSQQSGRESLRRAPDRLLVSS